MELAFDRTVALTEVGTTRELRIDSHFHLLSAKVSPLVHGVRKGCFINRPTFATVENGKNIPRQAYDITLDDQSFSMYRSDPCRSSRYSWMLLFL